MLDRISATAGALIVAAPLQAEPWAMVDDASSFQKISDRDSFVELVTQGTLSRFGIRLNVQPDGTIAGKAFGVRVSGDWQWRDGYFCRELFWGQNDIGVNCQEVKVSGNTLRFTSDQGSGRFADLQLR